MAINLNNTSYCYILFYIEDDRYSTVNLYGNMIAGRGYACLIDDLDDLELECLRTSVEEMKRTDAYLREHSDSSVFLPNIYIGRIERFEQLRENYHCIQDELQEANAREPTSLMDYVVCFEYHDNKDKTELLSRLLIYDINYRRALEQDTLAILNDTSSPYRILYEITRMAEVIRTDCIHSSDNRLASENILGNTSEQADAETGFSNTQTNNIVLNVDNSRTLVNYDSTQVAINDNRSSSCVWNNLTPVAPDGTVQDSATVAPEESHFPCPVPTPQGQEDTPDDVVDANSQPRTPTESQPSITNHDTQGREKSTRKKGGHPESPRRDWIIEQWDKLQSSDMEEEISVYRKICKAWNKLPQKDRQYIDPKNPKIYDPIDKKAMEQVRGIIRRRGAGNT